LSKEQSEKTLPIRIKSKSTSRANQTPISMARNNEISQLMNLIEKLQTKVEDSDKRMEAMVTVPQKLNKESQVENSKQRPPQGEINGRGNERSRE